MKVGDSMLEVLEMVNKEEAWMNMRVGESMWGEMKMMDTEAKEGACMDVPAN